MTHIIYRVDGRDFETKAAALDYVLDTHFPEASDVGYDDAPDQDGFNILVYPEDAYEDGDYEPVTIFVVDATAQLHP